MYARAYFRLHALQVACATGAAAAGARCTAADGRLQPGQAGSPCIACGASLQARIQHWPALMWQKAQPPNWAFSHRASTQSSPLLWEPHASALTVMGCHDVAEQIAALQLSSPPAWASASA